MKRVYDLEVRSVPVLRKDLGAGDDLKADAIRAILDACGFPAD